VHQRVIILTVIVEETARLGDEERTEWVDLGSGVYRLVLRFGFMEEPDLPSTLERLANAPFKFTPMATSYFLGRETLVATRRPGMAIWRERLFAWMIRNASSAAQFFCLPANQVIELGAQIEM
jgi:KUP system potassium uptake protein